MMKSCIVFVLASVVKGAPAARAIGMSNMANSLCVALGSVEISAEHDIRTYTGVSNADACCELCATQNGCAAWSISNNTCALKSTTADAAPCPSCASGLAPVPPSPTTACTGSSSALKATECSAWRDLYDSTNGKWWTACSDKRSDPCACEVVVCDNSTDPPHITDMHLAGKNLTGPIPDTIGAFDNITQIGSSKVDGDGAFWMGNNAFGGTIPDSICNLGAGVDAFNLANSGLTGTIPDCIGKLSGLQQIYLSHNELTGTLPSSFSTMKLSDFAVHGNKLSGVLPPLPYSSYWESCDLENNNWTCPLPPGAAGCNWAGEGDVTCTPAPAPRP